MEQRTDEWKRARSGLFTSSTIANILKPKGIGKTAESYIFQKAAEKMGVFEEEVFAKPMEYGNDWEYTAKLWYSSAFKKELTDVGFVKHPKLETGCSPDSWIHESLHGLEIKCPYTIANHLKIGVMRDEKELLAYNDAYYWQCKSSMLIMDCDKWDFASFDPRHKDEFKMFVITLRREEKEDLLIQERVRLATEMRDEILHKIGYTC